MSGLRQEDLWDPAKENEFREKIEHQLYRLLVWLTANAADVLLDDELIKGFHRQVFREIFPLAAGLVRGYGCPLNIAFGPHRGVPYQECEAGFQRLSAETVARIALLDQVRSDDRSDSAISLACRHHAEFIALHPFLDGNGRIGRICANYFAARYGLEFVEVYRTQSSDYELALSLYIKEKRLAPLVDYWRPFMKPQSP